MTVKNVVYKWSKLFAAKRYGGKATADLSPIEQDEILSDIESIITESPSQDGWVKFEGKMPQTENILVLFDTGEILFYSDEDWPASVVTHYFIVPQPPKTI